MPWFAAGDPDFAPAPMPANVSQAAYAVHDGKLWTFGGAVSGANVASVYSYDLYANAWTTETPLATAGRSDARAAILDGKAYMVRQSDFISYDLATGTTEVLTSPAGVEYRFNCIALNGLIYWALSSNGNAQAYDPGTDSWSSVTSAPGGNSFGQNMMCSDGTYAYLFLVDDGADDMLRYDPVADSWANLGSNLLSDNTERLFAGVMDYHAGTLMMAGGQDWDAFVATDMALTFDLGAGSYSILPAMTIVRSNAQGGFVDDNFIMASGNDGSVEVYASDNPLAGEVDATLELAHEVSNRQLAIQHTVGFPTATLLPVTWSTAWQGAADASTALRVQHRTTAERSATLHVIHDPVAPDGVDATADDAAALATGAYATGPVETGEITDRVKGGVTATIVTATIDREDGTFHTGGVATFGQTVVTTGARRVTVTRRVVDAPYTHSYSESGGAPVTTRSTPSPSTILADTLLDELVLSPERTAEGVKWTTTGSGAPTGTLSGLDAELGDGMIAGDIDCGARSGTMPGGRQTRLDLAREAVAAAGMTLVVLGTIPNADRYVPAGYSTEGRSAADVLADLLFASQPRVWYSVDAVTVDARIFTPGAGSADPTTFLDADLLADDGATWQDQAGDTEAEPVLADYLARCERASDDPGGSPSPDGTFETFATGVYGWTTRSGSGRDYQEVDHELEKEDRRLIRESQVTREWYKLSRRAELFGMVARFDVENAYHPVCPEALVYREEVVRQRKRRGDVDRISADVSDELSEDAPPWEKTEAELLYDAIPDWYTQRRSTIEQAWHAEGWLRTRTEKTREMQGMVAQPIYDIAGELTGYNVTLTYRNESREETYTPTGAGLWHIATTIRSWEQQPVYEPVNPNAESGDEDYGEVELTSVAVVPTSNTYTVVTDQAPPSVSCGDDPCDPSSGDPYADCVTEQTERWEIDHADWEARQAHNGPKRVWILTANRLTPAFRVGQVVGTGFVASVSHTLTPSEGATTLEVWEWLT